jgi:hypothetical protein
MKLSNVDQLLVVLVFAVLLFCKLNGPMTWGRFWIYGAVGSLVALGISAAVRGKR